jgi:large subunit ribosomal protein L35
MMRGYDQLPARISPSGEFSMPKQKTHKGTKKRFRLTAKGKAKHRSAGTSHLAARMSAKRKRHLRGTDVASSTEAKMITKALAGNSY